MELLRNPDSGQLLPLLAVVGGPGGLWTGPRGQGPACSCGCIILPTSRPTLLYLLAKTHKTPCVSHPLPGWGFPCLSGKASVSSSLENRQVQQAPGRRTLALRGGQEPCKAWRLPRAGRSLGGPASARPACLRTSFWRPGRHWGGSHSPRPQTQPGMRLLGQQWHRESPQASRSKC